MNYAKVSRLADTRPTSFSQHELFEKTGFLLTNTDRRGIERLLLRRGPDGARLSELLSGLLRLKLKLSDSAAGPAPREVVSSNRLVTYRIRGEGPRSGVISMSTMPLHGTIPVGSLLGATLIGMRRMQKAPLLQERGEIGSVAVLEIDQLDDGTIPT